MSKYYEPRRYYRDVCPDYNRLGLDEEQCLLAGETIQERKRKIKEMRKMEIPVKEPKVVKDGSHEGVIVAVQYRDTPLKYTDYLIEFEDGMNIKASYPTMITPQTIHGRMLQRFGLEVFPGRTVDPNKLTGIKCVFTTVNKTTPKGVFPEVMRDTLKPAPIPTPRAEPIEETIANPNQGLGREAPAGFTPKNTSSQNATN